MRRRTENEWLDEDRGSPELVAASLDDLWWLNSRFGGLRAQRALLAEALPPAKPHRLGEPLRVLDVGAGRTDMTAFIARELRSWGYDARAVALDRQVTHLAALPVRAGGRKAPGLPVAGKPALPRDGVAAVAADALALPFPDDTFDLVTCSLFFHHFDGDRALALLRGMMRVARRAVVVNDLKRSWFVLAAVSIVARLFCSEITRHDAPMSVWQSYTARELRRLAVAAGFEPERATVHRLGPFRLGLILLKSPPTRSRPLQIGAVQLKGAAR
jgi:ubiquinone/menaquinone biosynthesis C-methylase UbiE